MKQNTRDNVLVFLGALLALALALIAERIGLPQKWHAAIFATIVPFGVVTAMYSVRWRRWSFWVALAMCFSIHIFLIWIFFQHVISNVQTMGVAFWFPVAFVETFVVIILVRKIERGLTGEKGKHMMS
jgi:hypothetical protein